MILNSTAPLTPRTAPKIRTGPLCARGVLAFATAVRPPLADMSVSRLLLDDLLQVFCCRLSSFCCFCCLSEVYLLICFDFFLVSNFGINFRIPFFLVFFRFWMDFGSHFGCILVSFSILFASLFRASILHRFCIDFSCIFKCSEPRFLL